MNQSFLFFELLCVFSAAWAILELQIYVVVEQFGAEIISLLNGRLVLNINFFCDLEKKAVHLLIKNEVNP